MKDYTASVSVRSLSRNHNSASKLSRVKSMSH